MDKLNELLKWVKREIMLYESMLEDCGEDEYGGIGATLRGLRHVESELSESISILSK